MKEIHYIEQTTEYLCGQACVAMLANVSVDEVIQVMNNDKSTGKRISSCIVKQGYNPIWNCS